MAAVVLALALATSKTDPGPVTVTVSPTSISITDLRPGTTGAVDVTVTNISDLDAQVSVTGELQNVELVGKDDLLQVVLAGCAQPWAGVPEAPTAALTPQWSCPSGEIPASSGSLAAVPLEAGQSVHLLIAAGLGQAAGNGAQGQTWTAQFDVRSLTNAKPVLALTGAALTGIARGAAGAVIAGLVAYVAGRGRVRRTRSSTQRVAR